MSAQVEISPAVLESLGFTKITEPDERWHSPVEVEEHRDGVYRTWLRLLPVEEWYEAELLQQFTTADGTERDLQAVGFLRCVDTESDAIHMCEAVGITLKGGGK